MFSPKPQLIFLISATFFISCQTLMGPRGGQPRVEEKTSKTPHFLDLKPVFLHMRAIDQAFLQGDCRQVNQLNRPPQMPPHWGLVVTQDLLPPLTEMALKVCQAKTIKTPSARAQALDSIAQAQKSLSPFVPAEAFVPLTTGLDQPGLGFWAPPRVNPPTPQKGRRSSGDALLLPEDQRVYAQARIAREKNNFTESLSLFTVLIETLKQRGVSADTLKALAEERGQVLSHVETLYSQMEKNILSKEASGQIQGALALAQEALGQFPSDEYRGRLLDHISRLQSAMAKDTPTPSSGPQSPITTDDWLDRARQALARTAPQEALEALGQVPPGERSDKYNRLEKDAIEMDIREKRYMVRQLYTKASQTTVLGEKHKFLNDCIRILQDLITKYPKSPAVPSLERNLKSLQLEAREALNRMR